MNANSLPGNSTSARSILELLAAITLSIAFVGCGTVAVQAGQEPAADAQDGAGGVDSSGSDAEDIATSADSVGVDQPTKVECETDFDCYAIVTGKNPCSPPVCEAGKCSKKVKPAGTACNDPTLAPTDCQKMACNDVGVCAIGDLSDGTVCGLGACGKKCAVGLCITASATDYDDGNACTKDYCNQGFEVRHDPITDLTQLCDDGDACTSGDVCMVGKCKGQPLTCNNGIACTLDSCDPVKGCVATPKDSLCDDGDPCTKQVCDAALGCKLTGYNVDAPCDDGNLCTAGETCTDTGGCAGPSTCACESDADCKQDNLCLGPLTCVSGKCLTDPAAAVVCDSSGDTPCLKSVCSAATGQCAVQPQAEGKACDDGNACTSASTCVAGECAGNADKTCNDSNPCTDDACSPQSGCTYAPNAVTCDDGNPCTTSDVCDKGGCVGSPKPCDDGVACTLDGCDTKTGACANQPNNKACDDSQICSSDVCDLKKGCVNTPADGAACEDGDPCTTGDKCAAGKCGGSYTCQCKANADCDDGNPCTVDTCSAGKCSYDTAAANGTTCDTADKCQKPGTGKCSAGVCASGNQPVICTAATLCQNASCNPSTGKCDSLNKPDGTSCDADKDGCTVADKCAAGQCVAGPKAQCQGTACTAGSCANDPAAPIGYSCKQSNLASGTTCEDGLYCTSSDKCDGAGKCVAGVPLTCASQADACNNGACDEAGNQCIKQPKASSITCTDGLYCTTADHCDGAGKCVGGPAMSCAGGNCLVGVCDESLDNCGTKAAAAGAVCSDGSVCSQTDTCDAAGTCKGSNPVSCDDNNPCTVDSCEMIKGCLHAPSAGVACDDGNACTTGDKCDSAGKCQAGTVTCQCQTDADCNDANACTTDKCVANKCSNAVTSGVACDDKDPCSLASTCNSTGACVADATKPYSCVAQDDACNTGVCYNNAGAAACKKQPKAKGTTCSDGLYCTAADACDGAGKCAGGAAPTCPKPAACYSALCTEAAKGCTTAPQAQGTSCTDGNSCTSGDVCNGTGACTAGSPLADFSACDDGAAVTGGDFCYGVKCAGFTLQVGPAAGPIGRIEYESQAKAWTATANPNPVLDEYALGGWGIHAAKSTPDASVQLWTSVVSGIAGNVVASADQILVGAGGVVFVQPAGASVWLASSPLHAALNTTLGKLAVDWDSVDTKLSGTTLQVGMAGYAASNATTYLLQCTGDSAFAAAWTCKSFPMSGSLRMVSSKLWSYTSCLTCGPITYHAAAGMVKNTSGLWASMNEYNNSFSGAGYSATLGPTFSAPTTSLYADNWHANFTIKNPAGATFQWLVGPLGTVSYGKFGAAGIYSATVTTGVQTSYAFRSISRFGGTVLIGGTKPDPTNTANRLAVVMVHPDALDTQSGAAYWDELVLPQAPFNQVNCLSNGLIGGAMSVSAGGAILWVNTCNNQTVSKGTLARRGYIYYRPF